MYIVRAAAVFDPDPEASSPLSSSGSGARHCRVHLILLLHTPVDERPVGDVQCIHDEESIIDPIQGYLPTTTTTAVVFMLPAVPHVAENNN